MKLFSSLLVRSEATPDGSIVYILDGWTYTGGKVEVARSNDYSALSVVKDWWSVQEGGG